jgi:hypothetical protein
MLRKGQTIIEAMIGISILTTGLLGIMGLLSRSFFLSRVTAENLTATYLAAEGIELAKNLIDHDVYTPGRTWGVVWQEGDNGDCQATNRDFELDYTTCASADPACVLSCYSGTPLSFDPTSRRYSYGGSVPTNFTRRIRVRPVPGSPHELEVNSVVTWSTGLFTSQSVNLVDRFYNWHP